MSKTLVMLSLVPLLGGCSLLTLPVTATSKAVDWTTTSRDEADRNAGRRLRRDEKDRRAWAAYCDGRPWECR